MAAKGKAQIVVTGCGWVTPLRCGTTERFIRELAGAGEVHRVDNSQGGPGEDASTLSGEVLAEGEALPAELAADRPSLIAGRAAQFALIEAGIRLDTCESESFGLSVASGLAGQEAMIAFASQVREESPRFVSPIRFPHTVGNYVAGAFARGFRLRGPNLTFAGGAACGLTAIVEACRLLAAGEARIMLAGGWEALTPTLREAFTGTGNLLAEGACFVVLESSVHAEQGGRGALAEVCDWGTLSDKGDALPGYDLLAVYGESWPDGLAVERWMGRCDGASGAALVLAGIAAAAGKAPRVQLIAGRRADGDRAVVSLNVPRWGGGG